MHCRRSLARRRRRPFHHRHLNRRAPALLCYVISPRTATPLWPLQTCKMLVQPGDELCLGSKPTGPQDSQIPTALATQDGQPGNGGGREAGASELVQGIIVSRPLSGMRISGPLAPPPGLAPLMPPPPAAAHVRDAGRAANQAGAAIALGCVPPGCAASQARLIHGKGGG